MSQRLLNSRKGMQHMQFKVMKIKKNKKIINKLKKYIFILIIKIKK